MKKKSLRILACAMMMALLVCVSAVPAFAAGDVAGAIEQTWTTAKTQIQTVVNNVVFPVVDMVLAILFFVKVGTAYFDYTLMITRISPRFPPMMLQVSFPAQIS